MDRKIASSIVAVRYQRDSVLEPDTFEAGVVATTPLTSVVAHDSTVPARAPRTQASTVVGSEDEPAMFGGGVVATISHGDEPAAAVRGLEPTCAAPVADDVFLSAEQLVAHGSTVPAEPESDEKTLAVRILLRSIFKKCSLQSSSEDTASASQAPAVDAAKSSSTGSNVHPVRDVPREDAAADQKAIIENLSDRLAAVGEHDIKIELHSGQKTDLRQDIRWGENQGLLGYIVITNAAVRALRLGAPNERATSEWARAPVVSRNSELAFHILEWVIFSL